MKLQKFISHPSQQASSSSLIWKKNFLRPYHEKAPDSRWCLTIYIKIWKTTWSTKGCDCNFFFYIRLFKVKVEEKRRRSSQQSSTWWDVNSVIPISGPKCWKLRLKTIPQSTCWSLLNNAASHFMISMITIPGRTDGRTNQETIFLRNLNIE